MARQLNGPAERKVRDLVQAFESGDDTRVASCVRVLCRMIGPKHIRSHIPGKFHNRLEGVLAASRS